MFGFRKRDEMDQDIHSRSIFIAYYFTSALLIIWIVINIVLDKSPILPLYVLITQFAVKKISELYYRYSVDDSRWKKGLLALSIMIIAILFLLMVSIGVGQ